MKLLDTMVAVGAVTNTSVRLWFRAEIPGRHTVSLHRGHGEPVTRVVEVSADPGVDKIAVCDVEDLVPETEYRFAVVRPGDELRDEMEVGSGRFRTAPDPGRRSSEPYAIAVMSCHQPFADDGRVRDEAREMLTAAHQAMRETNTRLVLTIGDQMYSDAPPKASLFDPGYFATVAPAGREELLDCSVDEVRRLYQERYRAFWELPEWRRILAEFPCYPMLDDHEIIDNWGADPEHSTDAWRAVRDGALLAYRDYQGLRVPVADRSLDEPGHYSIDHGDVRIFVTDMRTQRSVPDGRLFGAWQLDELERFLVSATEAPLVLVVTTVPMFHIPEVGATVGAAITADGDDFSDRTVHPAYEADYSRFCELIREHRRRAADRKLILISGDIHVGAITELSWADGCHAHQLISSGITNDAAPAMTMLSKLGVLWTAVSGAKSGVEVPEVRLVAGDAALNPLRGLNLGFVEVDPNGPRGDSVRLSLFGHEGTSPRRLVRSRELR